VSSVCGVASRRGLFILLVPMLVYTVMHHASFTAEAARIDGVLAQVGQGLEGKPLETVRNQMRAPLALTTLLPPGLIGAFAAVMFAAFVTTHDTYLHSWGSVFVQDVILPFRKKPLSPKRHLLLLRLSIAGVAVFIFGWSMVYQLSEAIALYFAITGAIFAGGAGAVIIGGLYTRWGTTRAAWAALVTGSSIATTRVFLERVFPPSLFTRDPESVFLLLRPGWEFLRWLGGLNGQVAAALTMGSAVLVYVAASFLGGRRRFDLDRLLHRGAHAPKDDGPKEEAPSRGWRMLGIGREFTRGDKVLYLVTYAWTGIQFVVFVVGTIYNLSHPGVVDNAAWTTYWKVMLVVQIVLSVVVIVWFTIGGFSDLRSMFRRLRTMRRDEADDGFVADGEE
jgi:SSS family solute:Na+ symporter